MNPSFVLVLKKWKVYRYKQNRQLSFLVKRDTKIVKVKAKKGIPVTKFKITNDTDEKEQVECWTLSLPYNYKLS